MESLYLLIPLSLVLVLAIGGLLVWAAMSGQFESLDEEGRRILDDDPSPDDSPAGSTVRREQAADGPR